jgi:soluble lytic murein transglycosylase
VAADSPHAAHATFLLARERAKRSRTPEAFEAVANRYRGSEWAEESLLSLANHYQKDALDAGALPWWRRLLAEYPEGRYVERAAMRSGYVDYRAGRYEAAAQALESAARVRPASTATAGLLYWAGRSRAALGQNERARQLLQETIRRYKHSYHGIRARDTLARLGGGAPQPTPSLLPSDEGETLPEPQATRVRLLLMLERFEEASRELRLLPQGRRVQATLAWLEARQGRLRPALIAMKRAYPEWIGEAGDRLPSDVWRIMFPVRYADELRQAAAQHSLDPALIAALILQESTFDASALSRAGARGLMQVMPATGRRLAQSRGQRLRRTALHDPGTSIDFGTRYVRQMNDRFGGSVEKTLAAYNAGPHRVDAWTAERGEHGTEDFIEGIPFSETRQYVMLILANREQYRRLYGLDRTAPGPVTEGARP